MVLHPETGSDSPSRSDRGPGVTAKARENFRGVQSMQWDPRNSILTKDAWFLDI